MYMRGDNEGMRQFETQVKYIIMQYTGNSDKCGLSHKALGGVQLRSLREVSGYE